MPVVTEAEIHSLASLRANGTPITSCYLDVDGSRFVRPADYERVLDHMVDRARKRPECDDGVEADLHRVVERVRQGFDRGWVRGVAIFANADHDLFAVHELPVPVRSEIVLNPTAAVGQLELVVQQSEKMAVLAADKQHARVFVFQLGELIDKTERTDDLGRDYDRVGEQDRGTPEHHREELEHQHLRHAAELLWTEYQEQGFEHLVIAANDQVAAELEGLVHPYLKERFRGRLDCSPMASTAELRAAAMVAERRIEQEREAELVTMLRESAASGGRGVTGIDGVLEALAARRVERLLVSDGYAVEGWRCPSCGRLAMVGRRCSCGNEMDHIADVVEAAVDDALNQSCQVDVCTGNADLDVLGRIGALLRY